MTPRKYKDGVIPNVVGMGLRDAMFVLENEGLHVKVTGRGLVTKQSITAGTAIYKGQTIQLELN